MLEEMKIVISFNEKAAMVGIRKPKCDPIFAKVEGELPAVLEALPGLVEQAEKAWEASPRYPKCETTFEPAPAATPAQRAASKPKTAQPAMF